MATSSTPHALRWDLITARRSIRSPASSMQKEAFVDIMMATAAAAGFLGGRGKADRYRQHVSGAEVAVSGRPGMKTTAQLCWPGRLSEADPGRSVYVSADGTRS